MENLDKNLQVRGPDAPDRQLTLPPGDPLGQRFVEWFNHPWRFLHAEVPAWKERPKWRMETHHPLDLRPLWDHYCDPDYLLGIGFGSLTRYLLLDVDAGGRCHPEVDSDAFRGVLEAMETIGLCRPVIVRSSDRGGLHVYYFLPEEVPSLPLAKAVRAAIYYAGFELQGGHLEQFPNCKAWECYYKSHRLPMQDGCRLLDDLLQPVSDSLERFLDTAEWSADGNDVELLRKAMTSPGRKKCPGSSLGNRREGWKRHLERVIEEGWTGRGQTNDLLRRIAAYGIVWLHLSGQHLINYMTETARSSPGFKAFCRHQHDLEQRCRQWARNSERYYSPYPSRPRRSCSYAGQFGEGEPGVRNNLVTFSPNAERHQRTLSRVAAVVDLLKEAGELPATAAERGRAMRAKAKEVYGEGFSLETLHKPEYLPLWHPAHHVSALAESPVLPDPWEGEPESDVNPCLEEDYTRLPMEVLCPVALLPPAVEGECGGKSVWTDQLSSRPQDQVSSAESEEDFHVFPKQGFLNRPALPRDLRKEFSKLPTNQVGDDFQLVPVESASQQKVKYSCSAIVRHRPLLFTHLGPDAFSLVQIDRKKLMQLRRIRCGDPVVVCPEPCCFAHGLVYVKPVTGADDWSHGVAVAWNQLLAKPEKFTQGGQ